MPFSISSPKPKKTSHRSIKSIEKALKEKNPFEIPTENKVHTEDVSLKSPKKAKSKRLSRSSISHVKTQSRISVSSSSTMTTVNKSKKVSFKIDFVEVVEVKSFKKYNENYRRNKKDNVKCGCVIF